MRALRFRTTEKDKIMLKKLKEQVYLANMELPKMGLILFTWGNVSGIDRKRGLVVIKPSGVEYSALAPEDMVVVDLDGNVIEGDFKPSSDTPTHLELYRRFGNIGGITHTHSTFATSAAQAGVGVPALGTTHADYFHGEIPCTRGLTPDETEGNYELETGRVIFETFNERGLDPSHIPGVLIKSHGPFTWGKDAAESVHNSTVLEEAAKMMFITKLLNPEIDSIPRYLLDKHFLRKHGKDAYYGQ